jgi:hypothetical protein
VSRLLAEPEAAEVTVPDGVPVRVRLGHDWLRVERVFARWRVESDWWRAPVAREYWKLELAGDEPLVCEVFLDRLAGGWWLSRLYD